MNTFSLLIGVLGVRQNDAIGNNAILFSDLLIWVYNYWDYAYRGLITTALAAKVLGDGDVVDKAYKYIDHFESVTGDTGGGDAEKLMKRIKRKKPNKSQHTEL